MNRFLPVLTALLLVFSFAACDSFVDEVDLPIDNIEDPSLTDEGQIPFVLAGLQGRFAATHDLFVLLTEGLSDAMIFDRRVPNATFDTYDQIERGDIDLANNSVDGVYENLGELRFFADDLLRRADEITFQDADLERQVRFMGNFFGGVARYFYAAYVGLTPRQGGGIISPDPDNPGSFIPSDQMYDLAVEKLNAASAFASDYEKRVINSTIARIHLYEGNYGEARAAAANGLREGDAPFQSLHSTQATNAFYFGAGPGRHQWVADFRFKDIVDATPEEAARIPLVEIIGTDDPPTLFYRQAKYEQRDTPINFVSWQENELMLAELDLRDGNAASALGRINRVRASHGLSALDSADMDTLVRERDLELWLTGQRLIDQRRFNLWHLGTLPDGSLTWQFLPITQSERNSNPNVQ